MPNAITSNATTSGANSSSSSSSSSLPMQSLSEKDFLTLLVKQMTTQDPSNPQSNTEFVAQLAQFTALQQTNSMETSLSQISSSQQISQANSFLGQTVVLQVDKTNTTQGVVSGVDLSAGTPQLVVDGQDYSLSQVIAVTPPTKQ